MAKLIYAASPDSADMLYGTGFHAPDAFFFLEHDGKKTLLLSDLEIDRGRREARVDEVLSLRELAQGKKNAAPGVPMAHLLRRRKIRRVDVPGDFPLAMARMLEKSGIKVVPAKGHLWPEREIKTRSEIVKIRRAAGLSQTGILRAIEVLRAAEIGRERRLVWGGRPLTSEALRAEIDIAILREGGMADGTIVAGGRQACDPHERGRGPLRAGEMIILDVFPRDRTTGYFGDLTRTVVKGRASEAQRNMWQAVCDAQRLAIRAIKPGVKGRDVHNEVLKFFDRRGYWTKQEGGRWTGFFHGTGHGVGLELHEEPRFAAATFRPGQVFTVEPGLYYPKIGGARHEDMIVVTGGGCRLLSRLEVPLEL